MTPRLPGPAQRSLCSRPLRSAGRKAQVGRSYAMRQPWVAGPPSRLHPLISSSFGLMGRVIEGRAPFAGLLTCPPLPEQRHALSPTLKLPGNGALWPARPPGARRARSGPEPSSGELAESRERRRVGQGALCYTFKA